MQTVNIKGIDKVELLRQLWKNQKAIGFHKMVGTLYEFDIQLASKAVLKYIDYFQGKVIKTDLKDDDVDPWLYDRDAGEGAFAKVVNVMK